jgi:RND family efflux transporter MFP subunit
VLFTIDDQSYRDKVAVAQATLAAQTAAVEVAKAQAEKAQANFHKASLDVERFRRLFEKQNVSANELETYTLRYEAAKADLSLANSNVAAQEAQVELAKASLAICRKDLDDCTIKAPVDGCVSRRLHDPGEEVAKKDTVVTIVDTSRLRVVAALPAEHYNAIQPGKTVLRVTAEDGTSRDVVVTDKNPVIEAGLRTFELRALFDNDGEGSFVPGALVGVAVEMKRVRGYGIDISVPVRRKAGTILYTVENGRAKAIPVETGISQDGMVHVAADGLDAEMPIIVEGQYMIQDGDAVKVK